MPELYIRWAQFGLFCSHSRLHGDSPREPWHFGDKALAIVRKYAFLRYELFPYIYSAAFEAGLKGAPVIRAMPLAFPDDENVHDKDFPGEDFRKVTELMHQTSKESFPKCVKCWAKKLCSPCYGDTFGASGTLSAPGEGICIMIRSVARAILLKVAEFVIDGEKWKRFVENLSLVTGQCWTKGNEGHSVAAKED